MARIGLALAILPVAFSISVLNTEPVAAALESTLQPAVPPPQSVQVAVPFDGTWEGTIFFDKEAFLNKTGTPPEGLVVRIEIHDAIVRVFLKSDGDIAEMKPGAFHIAPVETNAVIFATDAAPEAWVETWAFVVTQKDKNTLIVEYSRLVNNVGVSSDLPESKFGTRGTGEFKRIDP